MVLTVDLWDDQGTREVNMVRHSPSAPSISTASSASYGPSGQQSYPVAYPSSSSSYAAAAPSPQQPHQQQPYPVHPQYTQQQHPQDQQHPYYHPQYYGGGYAPVLAPQPVVAAQHQAPGSLTRNLIGSVCASAFRLTDPGNKLGIWFILQDLSVRTEGSFRLKMNLIDVGVQPSPSPSSQQQQQPQQPPHQHPSQAPSPAPDSHGNGAVAGGGAVAGIGAGSAGSGGSRTGSDDNTNTNKSGEEEEEEPNPMTVLNKGSAPVLATALSDIFHVYSAKKFPGVIESTPLSRCFATQGIKIPIRKDGLKSARGPGQRGADGGDYDD